MAIGFGPAPARAELPAPDNLLYGTITLDSQPVLASNTNVVVEARRTLPGPAIASYRMGAEPDAGNFYVLKLKLEEFAPLTDSTNSSLAGTTVVLVVRDQSGLRTNASFTLTERGLVTRLDLGALNPDTDGDGLPDAWELARFGNLSRNGATLGTNGQTLLQNYTAGTDPNNPNDRFTLTIIPAAPAKLVSFLARQASGAGYDGLSRIYALEYTTNVGAAPWIGVPNQTNIVGNNSILTYPTAQPGPAIMYRGRVSLRPQ